MIVIIMQYCCYIATTTLTISVEAFKLTHLMLTRATVVSFYIETVIKKLKALAIVLVIVILISFIAIFPSPNYVKNSKRPF